MIAKKNFDTTLLDEGLKLTPKKRLEEAQALLLRTLALSPYSPEPFHIFFDTFDAYEKWKKKQKNPWCR